MERKGRKKFNSLQDNGTRLKKIYIYTYYIRLHREEGSNVNIRAMTEQRMIVCDTNDQSTQEGGGRGNGKAMHAGPIRHSHKINQLARSLVRSF